MVAALGEARFQRLLKVARPIDEDELRGLSPMVILAPHPDDETLGCGGLLATASAMGLRPRVAYLTDGGASHRGSVQWTRERLVQLRKTEAMAALHDLGVLPEDVLFLDWRDAQPHPEGSLERDNTVTRLRRWTAERPPASVWSTWAGEAHGDHVAAAQVAAAFRAALEPQPVGFEFLVWGWSEAALEDEADFRMLACAGTIERRRRALDRHASQTSRLIFDAPQGFLLPPEVAALTDRPTEIFVERS